MIRSNAHIGSPMERVEDLRLLRGKGNYIGDLQMPGMLHASILRSPVAHGTIRLLDVSRARAMPGVRGILCAADVGTPMPMLPLRIFSVPEVVPYEQPVLAGPRVRHVGEAVAVVLADSLAEAEDARDAIVLDVDPLPVVTDAQEALAGTTLLFEDTESNKALTYTAHRGTAEAPAQGLKVRRERFKVHRHTAVTIEPRGIVACWDQTTSRLLAYGAVKNPYALRGTLAQLMGLPKESVDLIELDVGGGFGVRGDFYPEDFLIPFAAKWIGAPVKWIEDRREHLLAANHARDLECELELACEADGRIVSLRGTVLANVGAYVRSSSAISPRNVAQFIAGPYRVPNIFMESFLIVTNKTPTGVYRGPGRYEADFFRERLFDMMAGDLGMDQVEFRRRNLVEVTEMPYPLAVLSPTFKEDALDTGDYHSTFRRCQAELDWPNKQAVRGKLIEGRYHGLAINCFIEGTGEGPKETARLVLEEGSRLTLYVGSAVVGQGLETAFGQILADTVDVPFELIRVLHGSTTNLKEGFGSFHSRGTILGGSAVMDAAKNFLAVVRERAALRLNCSADEIVVSDYVARGGGRSVSLDGLRGNDLSADGVFISSAHTYSYGAHGAHVAVNPRTGQVEVVDYVAVEDVGRIVNPLLLRGQLLGAVVQGLGGVFLEHLVYDEQGQLLTGTLADYLLPTATDFPNVRVVAMEEHRSRMNPLGVKGVGEGGTIPVAGVIGNAVADALSSLGIQPRELPLSPSNLWKLIEQAKHHDVQ